MLTAARRCASWHWVSGLLLALAFAAAAIAQDYPTPDFNRELEVVETIRDLYAVVTLLAAERDQMGYADQCGIGVRSIEDQIEIFGVPSKDDLKRAWISCYEIYLRLRPVDEPEDTSGATPELRLDPAKPNLPLDAPPGYMNTPSDSS
jgi:hypothetical protein